LDENHGRGELSPASDDLVKFVPGDIGTYEANEALGFPADRRDYGIGMQILVDLVVLIRRVDA